MSNRLDILLVNQNMFISRQKAKEAILDGIIYVNNKQALKPSLLVNDSDTIEIKGKKLAYVSRGGLKLEKAIQTFNLDLTNQIMMDIGSSTGGFTDCALQHHISFVYAIDVGTDQLALSLRNHPQVKVMEKTNFKTVTNDHFDFGIPTFITIDVSFISLKIIFKHLSSLHLDHIGVVALIKPQYEAGVDYVGKKGIIKDKKIHTMVLENTYQYAKQNNLYMKYLTYSPIKGGDGNIEFLGYFTNDSSDLQVFNFADFVDQVHILLRRGGHHD